MNRFYLDVKTGPYDPEIPVIPFVNYKCIFVVLSRPIFCTILDFVEYSKSFDNESICLERLVRPENTAASSILVLRPIEFESPGVERHQQSRELYALK